MVTESEEVQRAGSVAGWLRVAGWVALLVGVVGVGLTAVSETFDNVGVAVGRQAIRAVIVVGVWGTLHGVGAILGLQVQTLRHAIGLPQPADAAPISRQEPRQASA